MVLFVFTSTLLFSQSGNIWVTVVNKTTQKPVSASVKILGTEQSFSSESGEVLVRNITAGTYNLEIMSEGYETSTLFDIEIIPGQTKSYTVQLNPTKIESIEAVEITAKKYKTTIESPISLRNITSEEVQKNAGSNRDVSKAIASFPGVGTTATFRNDLFIRGGSSAENKFFVDGIEVPIINHFQTQGASGGPRGILTVDFIKDVDFYSSAFPANRNGMLSSLFEFNLKNARKEKIGYKAIIGLDDMQLMADGPLSKDESWTGLFSVRKSNLQLLFKTIGLPFLPSYYDAQFKVNKKLKSGDEFYILGIGAIDRFTLNLDQYKDTPENRTLIERLPVSPQWNYTVGMGYKMLSENGFWLFTWSRNMLDNRATKYFRNIEIPENLLLDYHSKESENKIRADRKWNWGNIQMSAGTNLNFANFYSNTFSKQISQTGNNTDSFENSLQNFQYGLYLQSAVQFADKKIKLSAGIRTDASNYSEETSNPIKQLSPRLAFSYTFAPHWAFNFNTGIYYQLPSYTALGFVQNGSLINKNTLKYIENKHIVGGLEYNGKNNLRVTIETYYKKYKNYPFSLRNQISLANLGGDFGVLGAEPLDSRGTGETYGIEILTQKRTTRNFYGIAAYTFGFSKFSDFAGILTPSSWDGRHIINITAGKYFNRNWNLGARFRLQSAVPETPYNLEKSSLVNIWNIANSPVFDYSKINQVRGNTVYQLDIRAEKKWIFNKFQITAYLDFININMSKNPSALPVVMLARDQNGKPIIENPNDSENLQRYQLETSDRKRLTPLSYFGLIVEF